MKLYSLYFIFLAILSPFTNYATSFDDSDEKIILKNLHQRLEFFIGDDDELVAELEVTATAVSQSALNPYFTWAIFTNNETDIGKIKYKHKGKGRKKEKPVFEDYESNGIFHSDIKFYVFKEKLLSTETPLEMSFKKEFYDIKFLDALYFNSAYGVENSTIEIIVPEWLELDIRNWNFDKEKPTESITKEKKSTVYSYTLQNLEPISDSRGAPRRNKLNAHLFCIPTQYTVDGKVKQGMKETSDLYDWYKSLVISIDNKSNGFADKVAELTKGKTSDEEKIKSIFYWVQDNIRYIAFEYGIMGFKPEECQNVYNNKYGDCKGMANLTKEMLTLAGYDARLTWLGTRDLPYTYDLPSLQVDNHMICTVMLNGENIFLDATEKYSDFKTYAHRIQGKQVMIEDGDNFIIETIPEIENTKNLEETYHILNIENESTLVGSGNLNFTGNRKSRMVYMLSNRPSKDWDSAVRSYIGNGDKNINLVLNEETNLDSRDKDLKIEFTISIENHITNIGNELYINPEIDFQFKSFEMPEDRTVPYEFSDKYNIKSTQEIVVPEGWKITYMPEPVKVDSEDYTFDMSYLENDGVITYMKKIEIKNDWLDITQFEVWNNAIAKVKLFYEDQIILSKI